MSAYQPDAEAGRPNGEGVDAYFSQLAARLNEAVDQYAKAEQAQAELQGEVTSLQKRAPSFEQVGGEAAALLQEAGRTAEQLVENARRRASRRPSSRPSRCGPMSPPRRSGCWNRRGRWPS